MGSQQVPGLRAVAVAVSAVPAEMAAPSHGHLLHQNQGMLPLPAGCTVGPCHGPGRAGPCAGGLASCLPRHAEPFSNAQSPSLTRDPSKAEWVPPLPSCANKCLPGED